MNTEVQQDPYQQLKEAEDAGKRIQANHGPKDDDGEPISDNWETLTKKPSGRASPTCIESTRTTCRRNNAGPSKGPASIPTKLGTTMDHSEGVQIPQGLLPEVSVLKPGLALCLKHSQVDKRYIDSHIELLSENLPSALYPSFQLKDTANGQLPHVIEMLQRLRASALEHNRVYFLYSPYFAARLPALMEEVDHLFYYTTGLTGPLLIAAKVNGEAVETSEIIVIKRTPKRPEERKVLYIKLPEGVHADDASRIVSEALASHYSGKIDIDTVDSNER